MDKINQICMLNPTAILVKGFSRCIICDLERNGYIIIPETLHEILLENKSGFVIDEIIARYSDGLEENKKTILEYFDILIKADLLFFTNFTEYYVPIKLEWDFPGYISNAIIDIKDDEQSALLFIDQVVKMGCRFIQIRIFKKILIQHLLSILDRTSESVIEAIEIIMPFESEGATEDVILILEKYNRVRTFSLFNAPDNAIIYNRSIGFGQVVMVKSDIKSEISCGFISHHYFVSNISTISESLSHNSCLNRKISIDIEGNIKNCPSMSQSFGNIRNTLLYEALDHPDFKKYWNVTKDQIAVCKDCEFRYICTDCRAYIENPEDMYSKPLKCGYNPYTCEWEEWSANPLKQKAIDYYGMREILPEFKMKPDYVPNNPAYAGANPP